MRIKAVEGIKAYNRGADLPGLRLSACLSVYSAVLRVIRTCVRQQISTILWTSGCRGREREREREREGGREGSMRFHMGVLRGKISVVPYAFCSNYVAILLKRGRLPRKFASTSVRV
jgi:hypothetical protein